MTVALSPDRALALLGLLSTDIRSAAVFGADGAVLAGSEELAGRVLSHPWRPEPGSARLAAQDGCSILVEYAQGAAIALELGPHVVPELSEHDLHEALDRLTCSNSAVPRDSVASE